MACQSPKPRSMIATVTPLPAVPFAIQLAGAAELHGLVSDRVGMRTDRLLDEADCAGPREAGDRLRGHARLDEIAVAVEDGAAGGAHGLDGRGRVTRVELNLDGGRGRAQPEPPRLADRGARAVVPRSARDAGERQSPAWRPSRAAERLPARAASALRPTPTSARSRRARAARRRGGGAPEWVVLDPRAASIPLTPSVDSSVPFASPVFQSTHRGGGHEPPSPS